MTKRACMAQACKMISRRRLSDRVAATVPVAISPWSQPKAYASSNVINELTSISNQDK